MYNEGNGIFITTYIFSTLQVAFLYAINRIYSDRFSNKSILPGIYSLFLPIIALECRHRYGKCKENDGAVLTPDHLEKENSDYVYINE